MTNVVISKIDYSYTSVYKTFFQSIYKYNKYFNVTEDKTIFIVNNGHIDLGIVLVKEENLEFNIEVFQAPKVCKLSILSLIESSVLIAKKEIDKALTINFKLNNASSYNFKFKMIFNEFTVLENAIQISSEVLERTLEEKITFRNITFLDY